MIVEKTLCTADQAPLIDVLGTNNFFTVLVKWLEKHIVIDSSSAIYYNKKHSPKLLFENLNKDEKALFYAKFLDGAYVATPAYQGFMNEYCEGLYAWSQLIPIGFKHSQMYASYYEPSCIEDLSYFFINIEEAGCIQFCIGRHSPRKKFSNEERVFLASISLFVIALIKKHWQIILSKQVQDLPPLSSIVSERVGYLLDNFESEILTAREREIAKLVVTGHSSQSAADKLNISPGTERVHRAKLYAKLKLRSSSELFSYFLHQLTSI